jgi:hypothetical protein
MNRRLRSSLILAAVFLTSPVLAEDFFQEQLKQFHLRTKAGYSNEQKAEFRNVGSDKQLFIDDLFFETSENIKIQMNPARKTGEITLRKEKSWESAIAPNYFNVMDDNGTYRMWYEVYTAEYWYTAHDSLFCYAESEDGIHWTKPNLGLFEWQGATDPAPSKDNNILFQDIGEGSYRSRVHGSGIFKDPTAPPEQRYKAVSQGLWFDMPRPIHRVALMYSPDGLHWTRHPAPINAPINGENPSDGMHSCFWDESIGKYVLYRMSGVPGIARTQWRSESDDCTNFPPPTLVLSPTERTPKECDLYSMCPRKYPYAANAYFAFCNLYRHGPKSHPQGSLDDKLVIRLAVSRDGIRWYWPDEGAFVPLGEPGEFDSGEAYMGQGIIRVGDELWQYYMGSPLTHQQVELDVLLHFDHNTASRVISRLDGYVSADAGPEGGHFVTPPLTYEGNTLNLNLKVNSGGSVRVGLLDENNQPVKGRSATDCIPITGDHIADQVKWLDQGMEVNDIGQAAGKPTRLRIEMNDAKLFAFQFIQSVVYQLK